MKSKKAGSTRRAGTFETPGGRSYLENLQRLNPSPEIQRAVERVKQEDAARTDRQR